MVLLIFAAEGACVLSLSRTFETAGKRATTTLLKSFVFVSGAAALELPTAPPTLLIPSAKSVVTVDFDALSHRDKLELAAELIHNVLQET